MDSTAIAPQQPFLTKQEQTFCQRIAQGHEISAAARAAGVPQPEIGGMLAEPRVIKALAIMKAHAEEFTGVTVSRGLLSTMLFEAHATAANSMEKISAVRELGKMHGMYEPQKLEVTNRDAATKIEQLEALTDEELLARANLRLSLKNTPEDEVIIDGEYQEAEH